MQARLNSSHTPASGETEKRWPLPFREFITLMALLMSTTAMSIDIMLPALPDIGAALGVRDASSLPLVVTVFILGMAIGQLVWGPLSDRFGRRRPLFRPGPGVGQRQYRRRRRWRAARRVHRLRQADRRRGVLSLLRECLRGGG